MPFTTTAKVMRGHAIRRLPAPAGALRSALLVVAGVLAVPRTLAAQDAAESPLPAGVARVCAGGDVTLGTNLDTLWLARAAGRSGRLRPSDSLLAPLRPLLADAHVVLLNVEGAIGEGPTRSKCRPNSTVCYAMRSPIDAADALRRLAGEAPLVGNLANNHARDAGPEGLGVTRDHLLSAGLRATGTDTMATVVATARGDTVAFLGFSTHAGPDLRDLEAVRRHVARAAERWSRVVVTAHVGAEGRAALRTRDTTETFVGENRGNPVAFAHAAVDAGADLVVGHGPHALRAAEWRGTALIAYSLGNLVTYGPFSVAEPLNRAAVLCADLDATGAVRDATLRSTVQRIAGRVAPDSTRRATRLADSLARLDFPATGARVDTTGRITRATDGQ